MRVALVHNTDAGKRSPSTDKLAAVLADAGYRATPIDPKDDNLSRRLADFRFAVIAGGDGTVTRAVCAAAGRDIRLAILPLGTANNIAGALGIRGDIADLVPTWRHAARRRINVWLIKGPWGARRFVEGCGLGALTRAAHRMDDSGIAAPSRAQEIAAARAALLHTLRHEAPVRAEVKIGDERLDGRFLLLEMLNFAQVGPRLPLAPDADPSDGLLDMAFARDDAYNALCAWLNAGGDPRAAPIETRRCEKIRIRWRGARLRIGDKYWPKVGKPEPIEWCEAKIRLDRPGPLVLVPVPAEANRRRVRARSSAAGARPALP